MTAPWEWRGGAVCAEVRVGQGHCSHFFGSKTVSTLTGPLPTWRLHSALWFLLAVILPLHRILPPPHPSLHFPHSPFLLVPAAGRRLIGDVGGRGRESVFPPRPFPRALSRCPPILRRLNGANGLQVSCRCLSVTRECPRPSGPRVCATLRVHEG